MDIVQLNSNTSVFNKEDNILLMLLPFWTPLIPPLGISCLKSYLQPHGYNVITADANSELELWEAYYDYNEILQKCIPQSKRGNFYNVGHHVLRNHLMAYINKKDDTEYVELVKTLVDKHYFQRITDTQVYQFDKVVKRFFLNLENYLYDQLNKYKPNIVGLSVYTGSLPASVFAFKYIKEKFPHIKTIMGGGVFSDQLSLNSPNFKAFIDKTPFIDKIFVGEGEELFLKYLEGKLPEEQKIYTIEDNGKSTLDLSIVDIPDFTDFDLQAYPQLASYASRSCPFQCSFCSETIQWGNFRKKNAKQIVNELKKLHDKHNYQLFLLGDSLTNPFASELAQEIIDRNLSIYWDGYLRADKHVCDVNNTLLWRKGGFYRARLGVESGSQHVLNLMDKRITPEQIKAAVSSLAYAGIKTTTYWVIGHPGETEEDFQMTLDLIEKLKDDIYEADCNHFQYYVSSQVASDKWQQEKGISLVYPDKATDMLMTQTWQVNTDPSREIVFERVRRFAEHCKKIGVPNPYSMRDIYLADDRWRKLHKNAVPMTTDFKNKGVYITENLSIK